jgi:UDP:flavonoid glycosyltransferase YjiC (YdhE family)
LKKILISVHFGDSIAHVLRTRIIAKDLISKGYDVRICIPSKGIPYFKTYVDLNNLFITDQYYSYAKFPYAQNNEENFLQHAQSEFAFYKEFKPDILVGDTGIISFSYDPKIPFAKILNRFYIELGGNFDSPYSQLEKSVIKNQVERMINSTRGKLGLSDEFKYEDFISNPVFVNGSSFFVEDIAFPYKFVGINMKLTSSPIINKKSKICLVILGTGFTDERTHTASEILKFIENRFTKIYVSYGEKIKEISLYHPQNAIFEKSFNKVPDNIGLLICHGGFGTIHLGIQMQVPMIITPWQIEQFSNASRVERLGWGVNIGKYDKKTFMGINQKMDIDWEKFVFFLNNPDMLVKTKYKSDNYSNKKEHSLLFNIEAWINSI